MVKKNKVLIKKQHVFANLVSFHFLISFHFGMQVRNTHFGELMIYRSKRSNGVFLRIFHFALENMIFFFNEKLIIDEIK